MNVYMMLCRLHYMYNDNEKIPISSPVNYLGADGKIKYDNIKKV